MAETNPKTMQDLTSVIQTLLQQMQYKFRTMSDQLIGRIDDMSSRIDDLEKNIVDLITQAGVEKLEGENKVPPAEELKVANNYRSLISLSQEKTKWLFATNYCV